MAPRSYLNFDLTLEATKSGGYRARVTGSPVGETRSTKFTLPFEATQLENLLLKLDPGRSGTRRATADPQSQAAMELGGALYDSVFTDDLRLAWTRAQDAANAQGDGLRLRLRLTDAPAIAGLPWELLYDRRSHSYLAQSDHTPLVRYLETSQAPRPLRVDGPLKVLAVISSPTDLDELDVEAEWHKLRTAMSERLEAGRVQLDRLPTPTMTALAEWLHEHDTHVLHFIGHGDYDSRLQDGVLMFCDAYGRSLPVSASTLGPIIRDHDPLRLVVLNACRSARGGDAADPFSGLAQGLVQQHVTAVVAMQFPISDKAAGTFAARFYRSICDGNPIDQSVTWARQSLLIDYAGEWATPVLFLRAPDGNVFDHIEPAPELVAGAVPLIESGPYATEQLTDEPTGSATGEEHRQRRTKLWLVPAVTALAAIGVFVWSTVRPSTPVSEEIAVVTTSSSTTFAPAPAPPQAPAPAPRASTSTIVASDYVGQPEPDAEKLLKSKGFATIKAVTVASAKTKGLVVNVAPTGAAALATTVTLSVSSGTTCTTTTTPATTKSGTSVAPAPASSC